jgi:UDP-N-acetylglucosamine--N-acetylmuramyl-(pentapeptide) pyrophosphoryl-undecaprenol N-acetylglucosamine transferase
MNNKPKILITGGHMTPAIALAEELSKRNIPIIWVGQKFSQTFSTNLSAEYNTINEKGIKFINIYTGKLWRKWTWNTLLFGVYNMLLIPFGFLQAIYIIIKYQPQIIMSFGGHVAIPLIIIGKIFQRKTYTHEQTIIVGTANKLISKFVDKIFISWEESAKYFPKHKTILTGNPIRNDVFSTEKIKFSNKLPTLLIFGGNQGANTINWRVREILPELLQFANVIHQTGQSTLTNDYQKSIKQKTHLPKELQERYLVYDYISGSQWGKVLNSADLTLSRAGANTITELLILGKLSIFIPIPWVSGNEQFLNAQVLEQIGLGYIIHQRDDLLPSDILAAIKLGLNNITLNKGFNGKPLYEIRKQSKLILPENPIAKLISELEF